VATAAVLFVPYLVRAPEALWLALVEYHAGRETGGLVPALAYKAGFLSRTLSGYTAAAVLGLGTAVYVVVKRPSNGPSNPLLPALWWSVVVVSAVHFLAPFPYDDYQAFIYPLFAAALAVTLAGLCREAWLNGIVLIICLATAFASPINQSWFVGKRDRIWWPLKEKSPLTVLQETADRIRSLPGVEPGDLLLTQDPYLAVETGLVLPPGLELGQFSYFPEWTRERAEARHVLNAGMFRELLRTCEAPVAAFSGYGLSIRSPDVQPLSPEEQAELWQIVERRYQLVESIEPFGQADTRLRILTRRE